MSHDHWYEPTCATRGLFKCSSQAQYVMRFLPQVLVEAETADKFRHSILLQNAETVRLVGPATVHGDGGSAKQVNGWRAVSVSELKEGAQLYVLRQDGARHTGISISEQIVER